MPLKLEIIDAIKIVESEAPGENMGTSWVIFHYLQEVYS
jgi:hypothetical protein